MLGSGYKLNEFIISRHCDIVALFRAYFDECGTHDESSLIGVGGAIGKVSSWDSLTRQWRSVLKKHKVKGFHATDYNARQQEFEGWSEDKRHSFIDSLFKIIKKEKLTARGVVFKKEDYQLEYQKCPQIPLNEYQFGCYFCVAQVSKLYELRKHIPPIEVVFEAGQKFHNEIIDDVVNISGDQLLMDLFGIKYITTAKKDGVEPFQVADLIVYELLKAHNRIIKRSPNAPRFQAKELNKVMSGWFPFLSLQEIKKAFNTIRKYYGN